MSATSFVDAVGHIGYPQHRSLDATTFEWIFEHAGTVPFLDWFSDNMQPSNVISSKELEQFAELEASGEGVLEGSQLEETLHNLSGHHDDHLTEDRLREEIDELREELQMCQQRKQALIQQRNRLSIHQTSLNDRVTKMDRIENGAKVSYKHQLEQAQADNTKTNKELTDLTAAVSNLMSLYQDVGVPPTDSSSDVYFMSQLDLQSYYEMEDKFGLELKNFTRKQFFEGIADIASEGKGSRYDFLEISNPMALLVRGEKEEVNVEECKELARLQAMYPKSECKRVNAIVEEKSTLAACQFAEEKLKTLKEKPYPQSVDALASELRECESVLAMVKRDADTLGEQEVPALIRDSAALQVTKVLRGNYDLKIARQNYFITNQKQLIEQLVIQRSRNEFLTMAYELEAKNHRDTHRMLSAVKIMVGNSLRAWQDRMKMLADISLTPAKHERGTVDSRDKFVTRLYQMLDDTDHGDKKQLFLTYNGLKDNGEALHKRVTSLRDSLSSTSSSQHDRLNVLESNLSACEAVVYAGSSTFGGQPVLSPRPIIEILTQLDSMLKKLEQALIDIMKDITMKKKVLKTDPLQNTERELFVYFYNDPSRLRRALEDVSSRVQAMMIR